VILFFLFFFFFFLAHFCVWVLGFSLVWVRAHFSTWVLGFNLILVNFLSARRRRSQKILIQLSVGVHATTRSTKETMRKP
jgi:hypothetical protein